MSKKVEVRKTIQSFLDSFVLFSSNYFSHGPKSQAISDEIRNLTEMMISKDDLQQVDLVNIFRSGEQYFYLEIIPNRFIFLL